MLTYIIHSPTRRIYVQVEPQFPVGYLKNGIHGMSITIISSPIPILERGEHLTVPVFPTTGSFITPSHPTVSNFNNRLEPLLGETTEEII
jgi:hypothetical protein